MSEGTVVIDTKLDSKGFQAGLSKMGGMAAKGLAGVTKSIAAVGTGLAAAGGFAIKSGIEFESAFAGVKKTVNASDSELAGFRQGIRDMAKEMPASAVEIAGVAEAAGQLGIKNKSILSFTKTMTMMGDATNMSSEEAATSLARLANVTGMPQKNFDRLGSTIVALGNNLATTEGEITEMGLRIAGAGAQVGMSEAQIMSFSAALSSVGINAEAGGTAFSTLMSKMNLAVSKGGDELKNFAKVAGMSSSEFKTAFETDAAGAIQSFIVGLDDISKNGGSAIKTLDDIGLSDIRMRDALLRAAGASDVFSEALEIGNKAWDENSALTNEAEQRYQTLESRIRMFKNGLKDLGISIYDSVDTPLGDVVSSATKMTDGLQKAFKKDGFDGLSRQAGKSLADMATGFTKAAPKMITAGGNTIKAFARGLAQNGPQLKQAALSTVKAFAGGIADLLPPQLGNAVKNLTNILVNVADPLLDVTGAALKAGAAMSGLAPPVLGVIAAYKAYNVIAPFAKTLIALSQGQMIAAQSANALKVASLASAISTKASAVANTYSAAAAASLTASTGSATGATLGYSVAARASAVASGVGAVAAKGFSAALAFFGGPVGLAVTAIGLLAGGMLAFKSSSDKAAAAVPKHIAAINRLSKASKESYDSYKQNIKQRKEAIVSAQAEAKTLDDLRGRIEKLRSVENKTVQQKAEMKSAVQQLNDIIPELNLRYDEERDRLNMTNEAIREAIANTKELAMAKAAQAQAQSAMEDQVKAEVELEKAKKAHANQQDRVNAAQAKYDALGATTRMNAGRKKAVKEDLEAEEAALKKTGEAVGRYTEQWKESANEVELYNKKAADALTADTINTKLGELAQEAKIKSQSIPDSIAAGIKEGSYRLPESAQELKTLMKFDDLVTENREALTAQGLQIPQSIMDGVRQGGPALQAATADMQRLIDFSNSGIPEKAKAAGIKIPQGVTNGIASGKYAIPKSISQLNSLVKFDGMASKAKSGGKKIMNNLASSVKSGKMKPAQAVKEAEALIKFNKSYSAASAAGKKTMDKWKSSMTAGKMLPSAAASKAASLVGKEAGTAAKGTEAAGKKSMTAMGSGIDKGKKPVGTKAKSAVTNAKSQTMGAARGFTSVGSAISSGTASGINSSSVISRAVGMATSALAAAKSALGIHSPSRVFRDQVGKMIGKGIAAGISSETKAVKSAINKLVKGTLDEVKNLDYSFGSAYSEVGHTFKESFAEKINAQQDKAITALRNSNDRKLAAQKKADKKEERALEKKIKKSSGKQKKAYQAQLRRLKAKHKSEQTATKKAMDKARKAYEDALKAENKRLTKLVEKNIEKLSETYQSKHDALVSKQESMQDKLLHTGELFAQTVSAVSGLKDTNSGNLAKTLDKNIKDLRTYEGNLAGLKDRVPGDLMDYILSLSVPDANKYMKKLLKMQDANFDEYISKWEAEQQAIKNVKDKYANSTLGNFDDDIKVMEHYQQSITTLKDKVPDSMWEEILGMDITQANAYMDELQKLSADEFDKYIATWNKKDELSQAIAKNFFSSDFEALKTEYSAAIAKEMKNLQAEMKKSAKNAGKAFITGLKDGTKGMSKTIKDICNAAIKQAKKTLKIKSPSRVFVSIGRDTIKGAEVGERQQAKKLFKQTDQIANDWTDRFKAARANVDLVGWSAKAQAAVKAELSRVPANVQMKVTQVQQQAEMAVSQPKQYNITVENPIGPDQVIKIVDRGMGDVEIYKERGLK